MKFPWVEVGEGMVKRQSSGEPRAGILDLGVSGRQYTTPYSSLALTTHKMPTDKHSLLPPLVSLKTLPDELLFPIGSGPLWAVTLHVSFQIPPAGVCPNPVSYCPLHLFLSTADLILSPTMKLFSLALIPSTLHLFFPSALAAEGRGGRSKKGNGQLRGEAGLTVRQE